MCVLADHQPANHQELELSFAKEKSTDAKMPEEHSAQPISTEFVGARRQGTSEDSSKVMFVRNSEHCAQPISTEFEGARTQRRIPDPNTVTLVEDMERCAPSNSSKVEDAAQGRPVRN